MATITNTTLESNAHKNVYDKINTRSYVTDPRNPNSTEFARSFVYYADPLHKDWSFQDFPYIVVEAPELELESHSCNGKIKDVKWVFRIVVRTLKDGTNNSPTNNGVSTGIQDMWSICDDLQALFNSDTRRQELRVLRMFDMNLVKESSNDEIEIQEKMVYESVYSLECYERIQVTS